MFGAGLGVFLHVSAVEGKQLLLSIYDKKDISPPEDFLNYIDYGFYGVGALLVVIHIWETISWKLYILKLTNDKIYLRHGFWRRVYERSDVIGVSDKVYYRRKYTNNDEHLKRRLRLQLRDHCKIRKKIDAWVDISAVGVEREKQIHADIKTWIATTPK